MTPPEPAKTCQLCQRTKVPRPSGANPAAYVCLVCDVAACTRCGAAAPHATDTTCPMCSFPLAAHTPIEETPDDA